MDKRKYEDALKRAKELLDNMDKGDYFASNGDIENIFPELKESKDERIREQLCDFLRDNMLYQDAQYFISWLEGKKKYPNLI